MMSLRRMLDRLLAEYGPQGWWPLLEVDGENPTRTGSCTAYHVGVYDYPRTRRQRVEICVGAILTQNTAWPNVEKALHALHELGALDVEALLKLPVSELAAAIRPSGYFNIKARKLTCLAEFLVALGERTPSRAELLGVWGIGPETADSIRLYAYSEPEMVVDAYTRRILCHLGVVEEKIGYDALKRICEEDIPPDVVLRQEFHALLVEHAKRNYGRRPYRDPLFEP
jgi:endonuclease-3 related protein